MILFACCVSVRTNGPCAILSGSGRMSPRLSVLVFTVMSGLGPTSNPLNLFLRESWSLQVKMQQLGVSNHPHYKVVCFLDHRWMVTVFTEKYGAFGWPQIWSSLWRQMQQWLAEGAALRAVTEIGGRGALFVAVRWGSILKEDKNCAIFL